MVTSASIGVSIFPTDAEDAATLMRHADTAMYHAKGMGRNAVQFFSGEMNQRAVERHLLETALREALEGGQFRLAYQPQLEVVSNRLVGAEALIRWHHPEWGEISPGKFIPLAEDSGLIAPIGDWVLREACRQLQAWQAFPSLRVAVNLSVGQLRDSAQFLERARATIGEFASIPPASSSRSPKPCSPPTLPIMPVSCASSASSAAASRWTISEPATRRSAT